MILDRIHFFLSITRAFGIARRYFVTNGFDGALTMLGLNMGFYTAGMTDIAVALSACIGAAVALAVSGLTSAYISESAEKEKELHELEQAMVADLGASEHGKAAQWVPYVIALVNGLSPLLISLVIISPLWFSQTDVPLPLAPIPSAVLLAFIVIFLLGVFLGRVSGRFWLWTGLRAVLIASITSLIVYLI